MTAEELAQLKSKLLGLENGFSIKSAVPVDERFLMTKAEMLTANEAKMPSVYFTLCIEDGNLYVYNKDNTVDAVTGKFRALTDIANLAQALRYVGTINNAATQDPTTDIDNFYTDKSAVPAVGDVLNLTNSFIYNDEIYPAGTNVIISSVSISGSIATFTFDPLGGIFDTTEIQNLIRELIDNSGYLVGVNTTETELLPFVNIEEVDNNILNVTNNYGFLNKYVDYTAINDTDVINVVFGAPMLATRALTDYDHLIGIMFIDDLNYTSLLFMTSNEYMIGIDDQSFNAYEPTPVSTTEMLLGHDRGGESIMYTPDLQKIELIGDETKPNYFSLQTNQHSSGSIAFCNKETREVYRYSFDLINKTLAPCTDEEFIARWNDASAFGL